MCYLCEESADGSMESCQQCGRLICFDNPAGSFDDVCSRAYVTNSGDLYCERCGAQHDRAEEEECEEYDDGIDYSEIWDET